MFNRSLFNNQISATGIYFYRLAEIEGYQMAIELMRAHNHPSHIWRWSHNLQMMEYNFARNYLMGL